MSKEESKPDIVKFLLGEEPYDDLWFGERKGVQQFWWRTNLRSYQENIQKELSELRKAKELLKEGQKYITDPSYEERVESFLKS